jgi:hypothetical protein
MVTSAQAPTQSTGRVGGGRVGGGRVTGERFAGRLVAGVRVASGRTAGGRVASGRTAGGRFAGVMVADISGRRSLLVLRSSLSVSLEPVNNIKNTITKETATTTNKKIIFTIVEYIS